MANITGTKNRIEGIIAGLTIGFYSEGYKDDDSYIWEIWTDQRPGTPGQRVIVSLQHQTKVFNKGDIRVGIYQGHIDEKATIPTRVWEYDLYGTADYYESSDSIARLIRGCIRHAEHRQTATV